MLGGGWFGGLVRPALSRRMLPLQVKGDWNGRDAPGGRLGGVSSWSSVVAMVVSSRPSSTNKKVGNLSHIFDELLDALASKDVLALVYRPRSP